MKLFRRKRSYWHSTTVYVSEYLANTLPFSHLENVCN